jgi:type IV secretion system protein VirB1
MDFLALAQTCAPWVAPATLQAIVRTESAFEPLAIGINGGARLVRQPSSTAEAVATAEWLIARGYNIDLGLGQVNSRNLVKTGLRLEDAFDPCKNIAAAATILQWNYQAAQSRIQGEQSALQAALSAYNTGSFTRGLANGYVQKVIGNATPAPSGNAMPALPAPIPLRSAGRPGSSGKRQTPATPERPAAVLSAEPAGEGAASQPANPGRASVYERATPHVLVY